MQLAVMPQQTTVGAVHFLSGRGAGGISGAPVKKNMALKGESKEKTLGLKGRPPKKSSNPSNFAVMAFVIMQTANQNAKNQRF